MNPIVGWVLKIVALGVAALGSFIAVKKYKVKPDNIVEEIIEKEIKDETGVDIDLSPDTPDSDEDAPSKTKL